MMPRWFAVLVGAFLLIASFAARASAPFGRYIAVVGQPGWVQDTLTGLKWDTQISTQSYAWCCTVPTSWCAARGARVPSKKELETLIDFTTTAPAIDTAIFPATASGPFATSTLVSGGSGAHWAVNFADGSTLSVASSSLLYVRCVQ